MRVCLPLSSSPAICRLQYSKLPARAIPASAMWHRKETVQRVDTLLMRNILFCSRRVRGVLLLPRLADSQILRSTSSEGTEVPQTARCVDWVF